MAGSGVVVFSAWVRQPARGGAIWRERAWCGQAGRERTSGCLRGWPESAAERISGRVEDMIPLCALDENSTANSDEDFWGMFAGLGWDSAGAVFVRWLGGKSAQDGLK